MRLHNTNRRDNGFEPARQHEKSPSCLLLVTTQIAPDLFKNKENVRIMILPLGRVIFSCLFFAAALVAHHLSIAVAQLIFAWILLRGLTGSFAVHRRAWNLLRWLVIPVLILHIIFTPGALVFPDSHLPITMEGIQQALWLSVHLALLFYVALTVSRALTIREWVDVLSGIPVVGSYLYPWLSLLLPMYHSSSKMIGRYVQRWQLHGKKKRHLHILLMSIFRQMMHIGSHISEQVWSHWDGHIPRLNMRLDGISAGCIGIGGLWLAAAWMI